MWGLYGIWSQLRCCCSAAAALLLRGGCAAVHDGWCRARAGKAAATATSSPVVQTSSAPRFPAKLIGSGQSARAGRYHLYKKVDTESLHAVIVHGWRPAGAGISMQIWDGSRCRFRTTAVLISEPKTRVRSEAAASAHRALPVSSSRDQQPQ
eukprot:COSAG01_NODE_36294_length_519_cov_2.978571_1_plen_151_part_10